MQYEVVSTILTAG